MERMDESDAEAVARARGGDPEAFRALVERYSPLVFRVAYRLTGNEPDAEDVVQETFLRAYRRLDLFEDRSQFGSWLYRIAANCAYDVLRGRQRRDKRFEHADDDESADQDRHPSDDPSPERLVFGSEVRRRLETVLKRLSATERSAFVLRHFEGCSIEEIGRALDLDKSATKHSVFRAVQKLRRALAPMARTMA
jgi:RNA polymerase sigma-70 factor (ECF subfamily)